jgi:hypothetical protein
MTRFPCPTCGHEVTSADTHCANCGLPLREEPKRLSLGWLKILSLVVLVAGVIGVLVMPTYAFAALMIGGGLVFLVVLALT